MADKAYTTLLLERSGDGITWLTWNRPEKRNAMNPTLHLEMLEVLTALETDSETRVLVLTGAGESWCAGQDLREFFRELDDKPAERRHVTWASQEWRWRKLNYFPKPTIAMVNGYCFGGAFTQLIACDFAIAAEDATFGLSEINWGVFPGGLVSRVLDEAMGYRDAMYYILTGEPFDGRKAAETRLITKAVPRAQLRSETEALARTLLSKNANALATAKEVYKHCRNMDYVQAEDYMAAKAAALSATEAAGARDHSLMRFLDEKAYRPGLPDSGTSG